MLQIKRIVALLLFSFLMLVKVSALHVYTHQHDGCDAIENCEICDIMFESQSSDFETLSQFTKPISEKYIRVKVFSEKAQIFFSEPKVYQLFSRPPPSF